MAGYSHWAPNCFTMAFAMPVCGYTVYRLLTVRVSSHSPRRAFAAGIGAYLGINLAALLAAVILGLQPVLFHAPDGRALYFPFGLRVTIPAMLLAHLLVAGIAEAGLTVLAVRWMQKTGLPLYGDPNAAEPERRPRREPLWLAIAVLLALSPLGLLAKGEAWGEWDAAETARRAGYAPPGLTAIESHGWHGFNLLPDYLSERGPFFYSAAGLAGVVLIGGTILLAGRLLIRHAPARVSETLPVSALRFGETPVWMRTVNALPLAIPAAKSRPSRRRDYLEKTLIGLAASLQESLLAEKWARQPGLLQKLDPRVKIVTLLGFVVLTALLHQPAVLFVLAVFTLFLARLSRLPLSLFVRRVWLAVPLLVGVLALPAALSSVTPGASVLVLHHAPLLAITRPGLLVALTLLLRAGTALGFVTLLTLTTAWNELLGGLRVLLVPRPFLLILAMTYRYLFVLLRIVQEVFLARKSRTVGTEIGSENRWFLGSAAGGLFRKSLLLTEEVHTAMRARGWTGTPNSACPPRLHARDVLWLGTMTLAALLACGGEFLLHGI